MRDQIDDFMKRSNDPKPAPLRCECGNRCSVFEFAGEWLRASMCEECVEREKAHAAEEDRREMVRRKLVACGFGIMDVMRAMNGGYTLNQKLARIGHGLKSKNWMGHVYGSYGTGKTTQLILLALAHLKSHPGTTDYPIYIKESQALECLDRYNGDEERASAIRNTPLLLIDEAGRGRGTPYEEQRFTSMMIERHADGLPTVTAGQWSLEVLLAGDEERGASPLYHDGIMSRYIEATGSFESVLELKTNHRFRGGLS